MLIADIAELLQNGYNEKIDEIYMFPTFWLKR